MAHSIGQVTTFSSSNLGDSIHSHAAMTIIGRRRWRVPVDSARPSGPPFGFAARRHDLQNLASEPRRSTVSQFPWAASWPPPSPPLPGHEYAGRHRRHKRLAEPDRGRLCWKRRQNEWTFQVLLTGIEIEQFERQILPPNAGARAAWRLLSAYLYRGHA